MAFALVAAACGDDNEGEVTSSTTTVAAATTTTATTEPAATATTQAGVTTTTEAPLALLADDAVDGQGASAWEAAMRLTEDAPLVATGEPFTVGLINLEGSPGGSFPEISDGTNIALDLINNRLGGIGADVANRVPGRPMKLVPCVHTLDPGEAQACANELAQADPDVLLVGIDFFTPGFYPIWQNLIVLENLPIFVADFDTPGVLSLGSGGCPSAFYTIAKLMVEVRGHTKIAVPYANNAPGNECWADTQARPLEYYAQTRGIEFQGFPYLPGDPADIEAVAAEVLNYIEGADNGAIHFGIQAPDCAGFWQAFAAGGNEAPIYVAGSCLNLDAITGAGDAATGTTFFVENRLVDQPELYSDFAAWELGNREQVIVDAAPASGIGTFMREAFDYVVFVYQNANTILEAGGDPFDRAQMRTQLEGTSNFHWVGGTPISCDNRHHDYESICKYDGTFAVWAGTKFEPDPDLGVNVLDALDLITAAAAAVPRG